MLVCSERGWTLKHTQSKHIHPSIIQLILFKQKKRKKHQQNEWMTDRHTHTHIFFAYNMHITRRKRRKNRLVHSFIHSFKWIFVVAVIVSNNNNNKPMHNTCYFFNVKQLVKLIIWKFDIGSHFLWIFSNQKNSNFLFCVLMLKICCFLKLFFCHFSSLKQNKNIIGCCPLYASVYHKKNFVKKKSL